MEEESAGIKGGNACEREKEKERERERGRSEKRWRDKRVEAAMS